jgi:hypothetical protein
MAAPFASAQTTGFGPFTARAHGTALASFILESSSGTVTGSHEVSVNVSVHRDAPGGNVKDDAQGSIVLHDLVTGTDISRIDIGFAALFGDGFGHQGLRMMGQAKVNDAVLDDGNAASYDVRLIQGASPNFTISVTSPNFNLFYSVTLDTVEVTPG